MIIKKLIPVVLLFLPFPLLAVETVYQELSDSVVYLQHELILNPENCKNRELFSRLEEELDVVLLNSPIPLSSGSGVIIDQLGYFLTNRHVVRVPELQSIRSGIVEDFFQVALSMLEKDFSQKEIDALREDFATMIEDSRFSLSAVIGTKTFSDIDILYISETPDTDLALLKINTDESLMPVKLVEPTLLNQDFVGESVYSLGYPLGSMMNWLFEDMVVTMNSGIISAIRTADLNIQHSAAISHGNSGGPLVNNSGLLVGINTASLQEQQGNSLFYAIGTDHILSFLKDTGFEELIKWNNRLPGREDSVNKLTLNVLGEIETSADLIINSDKDSRVFIDNEFIGESPLFIKVTNDLTELRISGEKGEFSGILRLVSSINGTTTIAPSLVKNSSVISFKCAIDKVEVYADGRFLGNTPLECNLPSDDYTFSFKSPGYFIDRIEQDLTGNEALSVELKYSKAEKISVKQLSDYYNVEQLDYILGNIPENIGQQLVFFFSSGEREIVTKESETYLPNGEWLMRIEGIKAFEDEDIPFTVNDSNVELSLSDYLPFFDLTIRDCPLDADIWIDGELLKNPGQNPLKLPYGRREVFISKKGYIPLLVSINIREDNSAYITWPDSRNSIFDPLIFTFGSSAGILLGSLMINSSVDYRLNKWAFDNSTSYSEYSAIRMKGDLLLDAGTVAFVAGVVLGGIGIIKWIDYASNRKLIDSYGGSQQ